jgi:hypothetical protein
MEKNAQNTSTPPAEAVADKSFDPKVLELLSGTDGTIPVYCHCGAMKRTR